MVSLLGHNAVGRSTTCKTIVWLSIALKISQRIYIMGHGQIVFEGTPEDLTTDQAIRKEWLEVWILKILDLAIGI